MFRILGTFVFGVLAVPGHDVPFVMARWSFLHISLYHSCMSESSELLLFLLFLLLVVTVSTTYSLCRNASHHCSKGVLLVSSSGFRFVPLQVWISSVLFFFLVLVWDGTVFPGVAPSRLVTRMAMLLMERCFLCQHLLL